MRITVNLADNHVTLLGPAAFTGFDLLADPIDADEASIATALGSVGSAAGDDHVWIAVDAVRRLAGDHATADWEDGFAKMLAYAATKGWTNDDSSMIKAHIVRS
ncbi:MAG: hypothetical protein R2733_05265 [Acidimicrobiales bacterium]